MDWLNNKLPDSARVWVYQSTRRLNGDEVILMEGVLNNFIDAWTSHKMEVNGAGYIGYNRFVILLADDEQVKLGGCSIDSSVHFIKGLEQEFGTHFFDRLNIAYKQGSEVLSCAPDEFEQLLKKGTVNDDTIVFNNLVQNKLELRTKWEVPYRQSWQRNLALTHTSFNSLL